VRSRIRLLSILRDISLSMYRAIQSSFRCTCKHGVGIRLATWSADMIPGDGEEDIAGDIKFHLALSYPQKAQGPSLLWEHVAVEPRLSSTLALSPAPAPAPAPATVAAPLTSPSPNTVSGIINAKRKSKSVRWSGFQSSTSSTTTTLVQPMASITRAASNMTLASTTAGSCTGPNTSTLDLCIGIKDAQKGKQKEGHCYGTILDNLASKPRYFTICPYNQLGIGPGSCRLVSLRDMLTQQSGIQPLTLRDRLQLAVHTASSVLQLYETPWLPSTLGSGDIFFAVWGDCPYYGHAFIMAGGSGSAKDSSVPPPSIIRNPTLLALGVLLIEIIRGQTMDALRTADEKSSGSGLPDLLSDYVTASRLLSDVYQASSNYGSAVRRCINAEFPNQKKPDLGDEDFRQEVYSDVVALLEEDLSFT